PSRNGSLSENQPATQACPKKFIPARLSRLFFGRPLVSAGFFRPVDDELQDGGLGRLAEGRLDDSAVSTLEDDALHELERTRSRLVRRDDQPEGDQAAVQGRDDGRAATANDFDGSQM